MKTQPIEGGEVTQALTVGFQSGGNKPLVARRIEDVWLCGIGNRIVSGGRTTLMVGRVKEMAGALFYYLCFSLLSTLLPPMGYVSH